MKKLYYVRTNGYDMLVTYDSKNNIVRWLNEIDVTPFLEQLETIEDDSSWQYDDNIIDFEEWLGIGKSCESPEIIDSIDFE